MKSLQFPHFLVAMMLAICACCVFPGLDVLPQAHAASGDTTVIDTRTQEEREAARQRKIRSRMHRNSLTYVSVIEAATVPTAHTTRADLVSAGHKARLICRLKRRFTDPDSSDITKQRLVERVAYDLSLSPPAVEDMMEGALNCDEVLDGLYPYLFYAGRDTPTRSPAPEYIPTTPPVPSPSITSSSSSTPTYVAPPPVVVDTTSQPTTTPPKVADTANKPSSPPPTDAMEEGMDEDDAETMDSEDADLMGSGNQMEDSEEEIEVEGAQNEEDTDNAVGRDTMLRILCRVRERGINNVASFEKSIPEVSLRFSERWNVDQDAIASALRNPSLCTDPSRIVLTVMEPETVEDEPYGPPAPDGIMEEQKGPTLFGKLAGLPPIIAVVAGLTVLTFIALMVLILLPLMKPEKK